MTEWKTPAGEKVWALWSPSGVKSSSDIVVHGKAKYMDHMGERIKSLETIDTGVTYILDATEVRIK